MMLSIARVVVHVLFDFFIKKRDICVKRCRSFGINASKVMPPYMTVLFDKMSAHSINQLVPRMFIVTVDMMAV